MAVAPWIVSDELWELVEPLLPRVERRFRYPGRRRLPDRQALQGILFVLHTGIAWRQLPLGSASAAARPATAAWMSGSERACGSGCTSCCSPAYVQPARSSGRAPSRIPAMCKRKRGLRDGPEPG
jgi:transposase